jgi:hypothetical protein
MYVNTTYTRPLSVQAQYSRSCPIISSSCYNSILFTWTVVCLTAAKFKPLIFPVSLFALSNVANICIFMIFYDFCLLPGLRPVKVKVTTLRLTVGQSLSLGVEPHLGLMTRYLLLIDSYGLVFVERPLWREDGSVFDICCWPSLA